jgi:hypothetical protein
MYSCIKMTRVHTPNPTTFELTTTTPALYVCSSPERYFKTEENIFVFKVH